MNSGPCQRSVMERFMKIANSWVNLLAFSAKCSNKDVWQGPKYAFVKLNQKQSITSSN